MELKDFEELLDQYDQDELTSDIIYEICTKFKELPLSERGEYTWESLNEMFGNFKSTGENLRCWVKGRQYSDGTIAENPRVLKEGQTPNDLELAEIEAKYDEKIEQLKKQKIRTGKKVSEYNRILRGEVEREDFFEALIKTAENMGPIKLKINPTSKGEREAIVLISDWHIGDQFNLFYNRFNFEIATHRVEKYANQVVKNCKTFGIKKLNVVNLGDTVNGALRVTDRITNEFSLDEQIIKGSELIARFLEVIGDAVSEVTYRSVHDNHGSINAIYKERIRKENVATAINYILELRFKNTRVTFPHDNLDESLIFFTLDNGRKVAATHGDLGKGINTIVQEMWGATRQFVDWVLVGHLHQEKEKTFQGSRVIMCNSLMGVDRFAREQGLYGDPSQTMIILEKDNSFFLSVTALEDVQE